MLFSPIVPNAHCPFSALSAVFFPAPEDGTSSASLWAELLFGLSQWEAQQKSGGESSRGISSPRAPGSALALEAADYLQYYSSLGAPPPPLHLPLSCRNISSNPCPFCPERENGFLGLLASGRLVVPCSSPCCPHLCHRTTSKLFSFEP